MLVSSQKHQSTLYQNILDSLSRTIIQLQSDEILEQMRNDTYLYECKMDHILETLANQLNYMKQFQVLAQENESMRKTIQVMENQAKNQKNLFNQSIDIIEANANQILNKKDAQISKFSKQIKDKDIQLETLRNEAQQNIKKIIQLNHANKQIQQELETLRQQMKHQKKHLSEYQKSLHSQEMNLTTSSHTHQKLIKELKLQQAQQIEEYQKALKKLQSDMLVIKNQWQKKCHDIEKGLRNFYEQKIFELEDRKTKEMLQHLDSIKQGKQTIVIKTDENMMNSKLSLLRQQHQEQIKKLSDQFQELSKLYKDLETQLSNKTVQCQKNNKNIIELNGKLQQKQLQLDTLVKKSAKQGEKIKSILKEHEKYEQKSHNQLAALHKQMKSLQNKLSQQVQTVSKLESVIKSLKSSLSQQQSKNSKLYDELQRKQITLQEILLKNQNLLKNIQSQKNNGEERAHKAQQLQKELDKKQKQLKELKKKSQKKQLQFQDTVANMKIQCNNLKKSFIVLKDDVAFNLKHLKDGIMGKRVNQMVQYVKEEVKNQCEGRAKEKMALLLDQIEENREKDNFQYEEVLKEKNNLKREVEELENCLISKNKQLEQYVLKNGQLSEETETTKTQLRDQLIRYKQKSYNLQENLINQQRQFHLNIQEAKAHAKEAIKKLSYKWIDQIAKMQEEVKRKDNQLSVLTEHTNKLVRKYEQTSQKEELLKQEAKKYRKKYEQLKSKSEQQKEDILNRLEKQSKQKIELDKQLRSIKSQINNYVGFHKKNKHTESTPNIKADPPTSSREQEFSELKNLIAKTYQISYNKERPQRDFRKRNYN